MTSYKKIDFWSDVEDNVGGDDSTNYSVLDHEP